jgi:arylsulfatase A-like enzyme
MKTPPLPPIETVILLIVDSLRADHLGFNSRGYSLTPTLDTLAKTGIYCRQTFTHAWNTQFSLPSIFTSSYPLDYGGYDRGIKDRPASLVEILHTNQFHTTAFSGDYYFSDYYGYERGFDEFFQLYDLFEFWKRTKNIYLDYYKTLLHSGTISFSQYCDVLVSIFEDMFVHAARFYAVKQEEIENTLQFPHVLFKKDFANLLATLKAEQAIFTQDPRAYIEANLEPFDFINNRSDRVLNKFRRFTHIYSLEKISVLSAFLGINFSIIRDKWLQKKTQDSYVMKHVRRWLRTQDTLQKRFVYFAYYDLHDMNFSPHLFSLAPFRHNLEKIRSGRKPDQYLAYELSLKHVDSHIENLLDSLNENGQLDSTLLAICVDHGADDARTLGFPPQMNSHHFDEEIVHVPMIFWNPLLEPKTIDHVCGLIDLAPTLLDLLGIPSPAAFQGVSVFSDAIEERAQIFLEHMGRGPGDLQRREPFLCIRNQRFKYVWQIGGLEQLYQVEQDPLAQNDVAGDPAYREVIGDFRKMAFQRHVEIKAGGAR